MFREGLGQTRDKNQKIDMITFDFVDGIDVTCIQSTKTGNHFQKIQSDFK